MENAYGIGITNRYALFLDEDADPLDILKQGEADKKLAKAKKIEEATKPAPKNVKKESSNNRDNSDKENQRNNARFEGKRVLDARKAPEGPNEERNNRRNQEGNYVRRNDEDGEGRGRGRGRGRGGRGRGEGGGRGRMEGGGVGRGGKREFERKSGDARTG